MDIYNYLKKDHRLVADLMDKVIASPDPRERQALFDKINTELSLHAETEEQTFYKAIDDATRSKQVEEKIEHANHEHDEIREYLERVSSLSPTDDLWMEAFGELKHAVTHHVEEEEGEIFEKAKKYLDHAEAVKLAKEMEALKKQTKAQQDMLEPMAGE